MKKLLMVFLMLVALVVPSSAHSGRTDSRGGHNSPNGYHYHHGYPAHQHPNGECEYDFDNKTGQNSGGSSSGSSSSRHVSSQKEKTKEPFVWPPVAIGIASISAIALYYLLLNKIMSSKLLRAIGGSVLEYYVQTFGKKKYLAEQQLFIDELDNQCKEEEAEVERMAEAIVKKREDEKARFLAEKQKYTEKYGGNFLQRILPCGVVIGEDGLPTEIATASKTAPWGQRYTMYRANKTGKVHRIRGCSSATIPVHSYKVRYASLCKRCNPEHPDFQWYELYLTALSVRKQYEIE